MLPETDKRGKCSERRVREIVQIKMGESEIWEVVGSGPSFTCEYIDNGVEPLEVYLNR